MVDPQLYEKVKALVKEGKDLNALYSVLLPQGFKEDKIAEAHKLATLKAEEGNRNSSVSAVETAYEKTLLPVNKFENRTNTVIITTNDIPLLKITILIIVLSIAFIFVLVTGLAIFQGKSLDLHSLLSEISGKTVTQEAITSVSQSNIYQKNSLIPPVLVVIWESVLYFIKSLF
ncbi:hypothetical protein HY345_03975 [Candidatus Microgenomates bacterium]|nr:hypothetical protein [Candidatus Microgenomates bacterium]